MGIGMVEMQGAIPRTGDMLLHQQFENDKINIYQSQSNIQVEKQADQDTHQVHDKENAGAETEAESKEGRNNGYAGDGGSKRNANRPKPPADRVIEKNRKVFDIKV